MAASNSPKRKPPTPADVSGIAAFDRAMRGLLHVPKAELADQLKKPAKKPGPKAK